MTGDGRGGRGEAIAASWVSNAAAWTEAVRDGRIASRTVTDRAIVEAVLARAPARALDVGCGEGWLCRALARHGVATVGVDASAPLVAAARDAGGGPYHVLGYDDLIDEPERLDLFDVVVCNFALLDEAIVPLLGALATALDVSGTLLVQTVHPWVACGESLYTDGWRTERFEAFGEGFEASMPWYFRTLESWCRACAEADLRLMDLAEPAHPQSARPASLILALSR